MTEVCVKQCFSCGKQWKVFRGQQSMRTTKLLKHFPKRMACHIKECGGCRDEGGMNQKNGLPNASTFYIKKQGGKY